MPSKHIENAERIERYLEGVDRGVFSQNGMLRDAVERCVERICEAAHRLGPLASELMPTQPWSDIRGMGNRLRHAYDRISLEVLWNAVHYDVPILAEDVRQTLARLKA